MRQATPSARPASTRTRVAAAFVDVLCMVGLQLATFVPLVAVAGLDPRAPAIVVAVGLVTLVYEVSLTTWRGQTIGKRVLKIVVVGDDDRVPSVGRSLLRFVAKTLQPLTWIRGLASGLVAQGYELVLLVTIAANPYRRGWHDRIAGTSVMEVDGRWAITGASITKAVAQVTPQAELQFVARKRWHRRRVR